MDFSPLKIVVCIKQVPDPDFFSQITIDPATKTIIRKGIPAVVNQLDKNALEEALKIREAFGGKVVVISMGPSEAKEALREALAMGADDALLLSDKAFAGADSLATSYTLAAGIKKLGDFDLVLCGNQTVDGCTSQVGPQLAEFLGIPHVTSVRRIDFIDKNTLKAEEAIEHGYIIVEAKLPVLLTLVKGINKPRHPTVQGILGVAEREIRVLGRKDIDVEADKIGLIGSPTKVTDCFSPELKRMNIILKGRPEEVSEELVKRLRKLALV